MFKGCYWELMGRKLFSMQHLSFIFTSNNRLGIVQDGKINVDYWPTKWQVAKRNGLSVKLRLYTRETQGQKLQDYFLVYPLVSYLPSLHTLLCFLSFVYFCIHFIQNNNFIYWAKYSRANQSDHIKILYHNIITLLHLTFAIKRLQ